MLAVLRLLAQLHAHWPHLYALLQRLRGIFRLLPNPAQALHVPRKIVVELVQEQLKPPCLEASLHSAEPALEADDCPERRQPHLLLLRWWRRLILILGHCLALHPFGSLIQSPRQPLLSRHPSYFPVPSTSHPALESSFDFGSSCFPLLHRYSVDLPLQSSSLVLHAHFAIEAPRQKAAKRALDLGGCLLSPAPLVLGQLELGIRNLPSSSISLLFQVPVCHAANPRKELGHLRIGRCDSLRLQASLPRPQKSVYLFLIVIKALIHVTLRIHVLSLRADLRLVWC
mmetsp:Transcript_55774/g.105011  ORF Transcript_55774/g.105011 Transcript_55774/m.105011 type:complete len:285 (-) Transcript_55774:105-959(-)